MCRSVHFHPYAFVNFYLQSKRQTYDRQLQEASEAEAAMVCNTNLVIGEGVEVCIGVINCLAVYMLLWLAVSYPCV